MLNEFVVVTTERGVFGGVLKSDEAPEKVVLTDCRCCVCWPTSVRGFVGLAATGPLEGSRITRATPEMAVYNVTSLLKATEEARAAWESEPWK